MGINENTSKLINFLKEYLPVIVIIPPIIGGVIQVMQLLTIGIHYLKFFSKTQLINDALICILFLFFISVTSFFISEIIKSIMFLLKKLFNLNYNNKYIFLLIYILISSPAVIFFMIWTMGFVEQENLSDVNINSLLIIIIFPFHFVYLILKEYFTENNTSIINIATKLRYICFTVIYFSFLSFFILIDGIGEISKTSENFSKIQDKLAKQYNITDKSKLELRYFNNEFIFYENHESKKIIILKFSDFMGEDENKK